MKVPGSSEEDKWKNIELPVFLRFLDASGLPVERASVAKGGEGQPDVICRRINGTSIAFELVNLCDQDLAHALAKSNRSSDPVFKWLSCPIARILRRKMKKSAKYEFDGHVNLLCHEDRRIATPRDMIKQRVETASRQRNHYEEIWLLFYDGEVEQVIQGSRVAVRQPR